MIRPSAARPGGTSPPTPFPFSGPLLLVSAVALNFDGGSGECQLFFDTTPAHPLADLGAAVAQKWTVRYGGVLYEGNTLNPASFEEVLLEVSRVGDEPGPDEIGYANNPSDIADTRGRKLPAFSGFPL